MTSPAYAPITAAAQHFATFTEQWPDIADYNRCLADRRQHVRLDCQRPLSFCEQTVQRVHCFEAQYEPSIYLTGQVPTRKNNWHDFFNMLIWTTFPRSKVSLNRHQYWQQKARYEQGIKQRTLLENILTQFDECGVVMLTSSPAPIQYLQDFDWLNLFYYQREKWQGKVDYYIFGHALYEKMLNPYLGLTGKVVAFHVDDEVMQRDMQDKLSWVDGILPDYFSQPHFDNVRQALQPLPLLGVPQWYNGIQDVDFYQNTAYFRTKD